MAMFSSMTKKMFAVGFLVFLTWLISLIIFHVTDDRATQANIAKDEIASSWGKAQNTPAPYILIPYNRIPPTGIDTTKVRREYYKLIPQTLNLDVVLLPERRSRGIYDVIVYKANVSAKGQFGEFKEANLPVPISSMLIEEAVFSIPL